MQLKGETPLKKKLNISGTAAMHLFLFIRFSSQLVANFLSFKKGKRWNQNNVSGHATKTIRRKTPKHPSVRWAMILAINREIVDIKG